MNETISAAICQAAGDAAKDPFIKQPSWTLPKMNNDMPHSHGEPSGGCWNNTQR